MPCVSGTAFTLTTLSGGIHDLMRYDKYRRIWWLGLPLLIGWLVWAFLMPTVEFRHALEILSTPYLVALLGRLIYWVFWMKRPPTGYRSMTKLLSFLRPYLVNPGTVATYCYLVYMIFWDNTGRADFVARDYTIAASLLAGWLMILVCYRNLVLPRLFEKTQGVKAVAATPSTAAGSSAKDGVCPLGFDAVVKEEVHA